MYFHKNSLKYGNDQRCGLDWIWLNFYLKVHVESRHRIKHHYSFKLQTTHWKNTQLNLNYRGFPCHLKVNRDWQIILPSLIIEGNVKRQGIEEFIAIFRSEISGHGSLEGPPVLFRWKRCRTLEWIWTLITESVEQRRTFAEFIVELMEHSPCTDSGNVNGSRPNIVDFCLIVQLLWLRLCLSTGNKNVVYDIN